MQMLLFFKGHRMVLVTSKVTAVITNEITRGLVAGYQWQRVMMGHGKYERNIYIDMSVIYILVNENMTDKTCILGTFSGNE